MKGQGNILVLYGVVALAVLPGGAQDLGATDYDWNNPPARRSRAAMPSRAKRPRAV